MPNVGTMTLTDAQKKRSTMRVDMLVDSDSWDTLRAVLLGVSDCEEARYSYLVTTYPPIPNYTGNVDKKGIITLQDENGHIHKYALSGYNGDTSFDNIGEHIEAVQLQAFATAFLAATTYTRLDPLRSPVIQTR